MRTASAGMVGVPNGTVIYGMQLSAANPNFPDNPPEWDDDNSWGWAGW